MYSKQLRKALSMVMVIAMIMSVCAVCFGTFGNAYTVGGQTAISGSYSFDFTDSPLYDSTVGRNLLTMTKVQNTVSIVKDIDGTPTRVFNPEYYGDPGDYMIDLIDKDVNLGSTDGHIVIQAGTTYTINLVAGRYVDATHAASTGAMFLTLALVDADGKVFLVPPAGDGETIPYGKDTWMKFGSGDSTSEVHPLKATIDGDGSVTIGGVEHAFAGCKLVVLCDVQPNKSGTVSVKNAIISAVANASETYTVNYRKDSDNSTNYPKTGGTGKDAVMTDLVWNYSGSGASYLHTDNVFRFCFAPQTAANKQVGTNYYPDHTHVYHVGEASERSTGYEFFRVADPDLATTANPYGKIIIEEGKSYSFSVKVRANSWSGNNSIGDNYIWVTYGLYNPATNAVYPLPYDESAVTADGADSFVYATSANQWAQKIITATVDCATIGPDLNPYAGCELVIMGGGTRKGANFAVYDLTVVEIDSPTSVKEGAAASIRPEIKEGDLDKFGADFEYKGYQSAGIRFSYTVADEKIANATDLGFVVGVDALLVEDGADLNGEWYDAASAMKTSTLGKKYADLDAGDTYAVTITGLSKEDKVDSLRSNYFYVAFYYTVNGVTTYVPLEIDGATEVAYDSVLQLYEDLVKEGDFDADVYGDIAWYYYN